MQDNQHQETQPAKSSDDPQPPPANPPATLVGSEDDLTRQLQTWLDLPMVCEQRHFLESHCDLLDMHSDTILRDLLSQATGQPERRQRVHDALRLLQDARIRGGTVEAVREAYINLHGGFVLDLPPWLEEVAKRLTDLLNENRYEQTAEARATLLQRTLEQVQEDATYAPELLATLRYELADAWRNHPRTNRAQALETAISICKEVLGVYVLTRYPHQYALTQNNLGRAYWERIAGERRENLEQAIVCFQEALRIHTLDAFPFEYARVQNSLGVAYQHRIAGERRENLEQTIACHREALRVHTLDASPFEYARVQNNLGLAYWERIAGERRENLEQAIVCYREALRVHTLNASPFEYAKAQNNLGLAYWERIAGERRENLEQAIAYYREALRVWPLDTSPFYYARVQNNLGLAYLHRIAGERRDNLEQAIACYREALRVRTLDALPFEYARTQTNLGLAYERRTAGERQENLEQAIACYREALRVRTLDAFPFHYAEAQNDLGNAYTQRVAGERRDNLEQAIACYREALCVYTVEAFPHESRNVHLSIAETEAQRGNWGTVHDAYSAALEAEDLLVILGAGTVGRDAILQEGHDASIRLGYALHRLRHVSEAAVAMERGRARGLAEAMALDSADPTLIADKERRSRYITVRAALITAQANLHALSSQNLDEDTRRRRDLEYTAAYRQAKDAFDAMITEIRAAHDPDDFLDSSLDAATILRAAERVGPSHAFVYLASTPWGGIAVAAMSTQRSSSASFAALDLPDLKEAFVNALIEMRLDDGSERRIGGLTLAQMSEGFEQLQQQWNGETLQAKAKALRAACRKSKQESTLDSAAQETMKRRPLTRAAKQPLASLNHAEQSELRITFDQIFLQQELDRCLEQLGTTVMHPLISWLREQGATSLTLIPCGHLATFPLASIILPDGRSVSETLPTSIAPSARSLLHPIDTRDAQAGVYALGDPHHNLPWSEAEALTLTALAHRFALPAEAHVKQQATRERLLSALGSRWIVDASCHGNFDHKNFLQSALLLAQKGHITMSEMLSHQADLRGLRLLLLSACQTALLDLQGARDEVHSLAAAMLQAGAQAVLAAQWAVDDKATYLLIVRFFQEWLPNMKQEPPAVALARAQSWLRNVTNAELAAWHSTMPTPPNMKQLTRTGSSARQLGQSTKHKPKIRWQRIPVRGRQARYLEDEAQLAVRIGAEEDDPSAHPYADPYFWAGFQVIGW